MEPLPPIVAKLAAEIVIPDPDSTDPEATVTLNVQQIRQIAVLLTSLIDYIQIQYARCAEKKAEGSP
jgi:hypothetical protein